VAPEPAPPDAGTHNRDPGLQPERTALAWTRTAFAILANALISLRAGFISGSVPLLALAVALFLGAAYTFRFAGLRRRVLLQREAVPVPSAAIALTSAIVLAACLAGLVVLLEPYLHLGQVHPDR
jgi:uncharacterized membrane protein YidH (DUF202 family)